MESGKANSFKSPAEAEHESYTSCFNSESQRFLRFKLCQKSSQFLRCRKAAPFSDLRHAHWLRSRLDGKTTIRAGGGSRCSYSH